MLDEFRAKKLQVIEGLAQLCDLARSLGAQSLATRLDTEVLRKVEADRFHLVVVGEFNHGKTALVNALLGREVLPVGVTPTTTVIHHLVYADVPGARVVDGSGEAETIPFDEVRGFASGGERADDSVRYLEVQYPAELLRDRIVLVDTPGVNDLSLTRAEITFDYIPRSDAVLFVLDAGQPVKESEREFLEKQLIGKSRDKIVFVVNKADIWTEEEREQALAYVRERLAGLVEEPVVFAVSATAALTGSAAASGLPELVRHLTRMLAEERGRILLGNALAEGVGAASGLARGIDARRRAMRMTAEQLAERIAMLESDLAGHADSIEQRRSMVREETAAIKAWARRDLDRFCEDTLDKLPSMLAQASGEDVRQHLGVFLQHSFRSWAKAETEEVAHALEQLAERTVALLREDAHDVGRRVGDALGQQLETPSIEVDTFVYDVGVFAMLSLGLGVVFANVLLGGLLLAAAPALALYSRDRTEVEIRRRAQEVAGVALHEAAAKVAPKLDEMVDEFREGLDSWVVATGQELHREIIEVLGQVRTERDRGQGDLDSEGERCDRSAEELERVRSKLASLRGDSSGEEKRVSGASHTGGQQ